MLDALRLYGRYVSVSVRAQLEYRASTLLLAAGNFALTGIEFFAMWALFDRFGQLRGFSLAEVALLYGMANAAFALSEMGSSGFKTFDRLVKSGEFDRLLLRPRSTVFQVAAQELEFRRLGRLAQGLAVLLWAAGDLEVAWTLPRLGLLLAAILSGAAVFTGLFVLQATLAFWTTEGLEIVNSVTYGGVETTQYPLAIYERWFRRFFTWVVPLATMNYFPALGITGRPDPLGSPVWLPWVSPLIGFLFLGAALGIWRFGERRYRSTGS